MDGYVPDRHLKVLGRKISVESAGLFVGPVILYGEAFDSP